MTFPRFLIAGFVNTVLTYVLYLGLLFLMSYVWAYSLTYVIGIGMGYLLNAYWVFHRAPSLGSAVAYPFTYALNFLLGLSMLWLLVEVIHIPEEIAPLLVVVLTAPIMYVVTQSIFSGRIDDEKTNHQ